MPTLFARRDMRGRPARTERTIGVCLLGLLAVIVGAFLLTGGLFAGTVERVVWLRHLKAMIGISEAPLFTVAPENRQPPAPRHALRVAAAMLPERADPWRRTALMSHAVRAGQTEAATALDDLPVDARIPVENLEAVGARGVYLAVYTRGEDAKPGAWVSVVDAGSPASARDLFTRRRPESAQATSTGCEGWLSDDGWRGGFWAGRYYSEGVAAHPVDRMADLIASIARRQLVYGIAVASVEVDSVPETDTDRTRPAVASFAKVQNADLFPPSKVERYTDNLYEKIDGKEGMFRAYLFEELRFGQYQNPRDQTVFDVYIFDQGGPENAYGIYMAERSPTADALPIGREGYASGSSVYFAKDKYYVNVLGPEDGGPEAQAASKQIALAIAGTIPDTDEPFWAEAYLPGPDRVAHTFTYYATSGLGYDFLRELYLAEYETGGQAYQLFVTRAADASAAAALFGQYVEATARYDKVVSREPVDHGEIMVGESMGVFTVAFTKGVYFGGVVECEDASLSKRQAEALRERLPLTAEAEDDGSED